MPRKMLIGVLLFLGFAAGCVGHNPHQHGGRLINESTPEAAHDTTTTPRKAVYALYQWRSLPKNQPAPQQWIPEHEVAELYVRGLDRGAKIGFCKGEKGELFAVAGSEKIQLEPGRYCWHLRAAEPRNGWDIVHECGETIKEVIGDILGIPVGIVALILLLPFFLLFFPIILCSVL